MIIMAVTHGVAVCKLAAGAGAVGRSGYTLSVPVLAEGPRSLSRSSSRSRSLSLARSLYSLDNGSKCAALSRPCMPAGVSQGAGRRAGRRRAARGVL
eukprot:COSAG01_NODE_3348_length_6224_cov_43.028245_2_plen_97_part_00